MNLLKTILSYKTGMLLLLALVSWLFLALVIFPRHTNYQGNETEFIGTVKKVKITDKQINFRLVIKNKETLQATYFIDSPNNLNIEVGDTVKVTGKLTNIPNQTIPGLYSYKNYYASLDIYNYLEVTDLLITKKGPFSLKKLISKQISKSPKSKPYLEAFFLANTDLISKTLTESYQQNGISHLFSVSGMHLSLLVLVLKNRPKFCLILLGLFLYLFDGSVSFLRAFLSWLLFSINKKYNFSINRKIIASLSIILLLLYNPYYIYQIGFWYSSLISLVLIFNSNLLSKNKNYIKKTGLISLIAFITSIPISLYSFFSLNFLSPLWNLFFVPFYTFLIVPFSLLCFIFPGLDNYFFVIICIFEQISLKLANINIGTFILGKPDMITIFFIIGGILLFLYGLNKKRKTYYLPLIIIMVVLIIKPISNKTEIYILDVGQGDSILLKSRGKTMLIDTSKNKGTELVSFFKSLKITNLDYLVISHGDIDHIGGANEILKSIQINEIIYNLGSITQEEQKLMNTANRKNIKLSQCSSNREIELGNIKLVSLNKAFTNENESSCIFYAVRDALSFLFTGDSGKEAEKILLKNYRLAPITFLKVGHHGSNTSTSSELLNTLNPKYAFISVGIKNSYHHPSKEVISNLKKHNIIVKSTSVYGTIRLILEKKSTISTYPPYNNIGRH